MQQGYKSVNTNFFQYKRIVLLVYEFIKILVLALAIVIPIRYFLIQPFYVKGASMEPNFHNNQYLIVNEISYRFEDPKRGDIIVFKYPRDPKQYFIKRIIALPGEEVKIENGELFIKKQDSKQWLLLDESEYLSTSVRTYPNNIFKLEKNEYFVLGDNRGASMDSRIFGPIKRHFIIGRTWLRAWPFDKLSVFDHIHYSIDK